jgi:hypothetical protein
VKLGVELVSKPDLMLEVEGRYDPVADVAAIRRARLEARIDARREAAPSVESIVEGLYVESFSVERLDAERQTFMPAAEAATPPPAAPPKKGKKSEAPPPPPMEGFDAAGFYDALRAQLLAAEEVPESTLAELARHARRRSS